ncbi:MAG: hypothetical protein IPL78_03385 [Chloroflexi bacterium]|nr:hypothetical protein [Chloroflexota bacterium]
MLYYIFGCALSIIGAYFGQRGAQWVRTWAKAKLGDSPMNQLFINLFMGGIGLTMMILLVTLSTFTA